MNCYTCKFRRDIPGDTHSECRIIDDTGSMVSMFLLARLTNGIKTERVEVRLNPHGVINGWAEWPINFDPVWVEHCNLHREK